MLTASPKANGFYKAGLVKKYIPGIYRVNEQRVLQRAAKSKSDISMFEYENGDWTFHGKGAWFYDNTMDKCELSVIGSSNYSYRSNRRDTEC